MRKEQFFQNTEAEHSEEVLEQNPTDQEETLPLDEIKKNANNADQELKISHSGWRNISDVIEKYLQNRNIKIKDVIENLLNKQKNGCESLILEQNNELKTSNNNTRDKLRNFFSKSMRQIYKGAKAGLDLVPDTQKLVDNLGINTDLEQDPVKRNLVEALNVAGGIRFYSIEKGIINYEEENNNRLKRIINGVNSFLDKNEELKLWLQDIIKTAATKK